MSPRFSPSGSKYLNNLLRKANVLVAQYRLLIAMFIALIFFAGASVLIIRADLFGPSPVIPATTSSSSSSVEQLMDRLACSSSGTLFGQKDIDGPAKAQDKFKEQLDLVFEEHEALLKNPSKWTCSTDGADSIDPDMPALKALAATMPGWKQRTGVDTYQTKPVTFASYPSIVLEFEREYECKLTEFENDALGIAAEGKDGDGTTPAPLTFEPSTTRARKHWLNMNDERIRARKALERTLAAYRSYDLMVPLTTRLNCLIREQMDLRTELSLLADTMSCMPRIWDAVTSLHDRSPDSPYNK